MPIQELTAIESSQTVNVIDETTTDLLHCHLDIVEKHDGDELNEDLFPLIDSVFDDLSSSTETNVNADVSEIDDPPLHAYTSVKTLIFCRRFLFWRFRYIFPRTKSLSNLRRRVSIR